MDSAGACPHKTGCLHERVPARRAQHQGKQPKTRAHVHHKRKTGVRDLSKEGNREGEWRPRDNMTNTEATEEGGRNSELTGKQEDRKLPKAALSF